MKECPTCHHKIETVEIFNFVRYFKNENTHKEMSLVSYSDDSFELYTGKELVEKFKVLKTEIR